MQTTTRCRLNNSREPAIHVYGSIQTRSHVVYQSNNLPDETAWTRTETQFTVSGTYGCNTPVRSCGDTLHSFPLLGMSRMPQTLLRQTQQHTSPEYEALLLLSPRYTRHPNHAVCVLEIESDGDGDDDFGGKYDCRGKTAAEINQWLAHQLCDRVCVGENGRVYTATKSVVRLSVCVHGTECIHQAYDKCACTRSETTMLEFVFDPVIHVRVVVGITVGGAVRLSDMNKNNGDGKGDTIIDIVTPSVFVATLHRIVPLSSVAEYPTAKVSTTRWTLYLPGFVYTNCDNGNGNGNGATHSGPLTPCALACGVIVHSIVPDSQLDSFVSSSNVNVNVDTHLNPALDSTTIADLSTWLVGQIEQRQQMRASTSSVKKIWSTVVSRIMAWVVGQFISQISAPSSSSS